jgi:RNA recognition motif-containing protein
LEFQESFSKKLAYNLTILSIKEEVLIRMKISYSNFPQTLEESAIQKMFEAFGKVESFTLKKDKLTKKSLGYGNLEMDDASGQKAINGLHGKTVEEKVLSVGNLEELQAKVQDKKGAGLASNNLGGSKFHGRTQSIGTPGVQRRGGNRGS